MNKTNRDKPLDQIFCETISLGINWSFHQSNRFVWPEFVRIGVHLKSGQLGVSLKPEGIPVQVFVHELNQVVAIQVLPLVDRFGQSGHLIVLVGQIGEWCAFAASDVALQTHLFQQLTTQLHYYTYWCHSWRSFTVNTLLAICLLNIAFMSSDFNSIGLESQNYQL